MSSERPKPNPVTVDDFGVPSRFNFGGKSWSVSDLRIPAKDRQMFYRPVTAMIMGKEMKMALSEDFIRRELRIQREKSKKGHLDKQ